MHGLKIAKTLTYPRYAVWPEVERLVGAVLGEPGDEDGRKSQGHAESHQQHVLDEGGHDLGQRFLELGLLLLLAELTGNAEKLVKEKQD